MYDLELIASAEKLAREVIQVKKEDRLRIVQMKADEKQ